MMNEDRVTSRGCPIPGVRLKLLKRKGEKENDIFIYISKSNPQPDSIKYEEKFTKSQMEMIESCKSKVDNATYQGVNNLWNGQWEFWNRVRGTTVEGAVNYYKPLFEQVIEEEKKLAK